MVGLYVLAGGIFIVLLVLNSIIWLRERAAGDAWVEVAEVGDVFNRFESRFGRSFAGADFIAAAIVLILSVLAPRILMVFSRPLPTFEDGYQVTKYILDWRLAIPAAALLLTLNWVTIHRRHAGLLDWKWSGAAAAIIPIGFVGLWYVVELGTVWVIGD